ncbi:hydroxymethylglutaryl-CoA lyase [Phaeocystidibacter luteus]|uniref:Hydroxymethylglutaryl-CoA lyase n=1 Tax=Phaeocystidibacter luteus TaxID=911197 RepID=A0A6N6RLF4_9FLAO|nr:hydroxymethylglutaryl-CoA lyase [Phaeocystidibacter luteus]KAB2814391.1 hydroxymethylglutaryl-CoA lyase [Phaeocystidibacter luteus]
MKKSHDSHMDIVECPRDAMQGIHPFIPTQRKVDYINSLLKVGFNTLDFGSFVSPKAIPQLRDTQEVLDKLDLDGVDTRLLSIVANVRGAELACANEQIDDLGFPFSLSETFQQRNTNRSMSEAFDIVKEIGELTRKHDKRLVVYLSMGFGNPYNEPWNVDIVEEWAEKMVSEGVEVLSLSDTIGTSNPDSIEYLFSALIPRFPKVTFGAHLHTTPDTWHEKVDTAWKAGCRRFDGAIKGFGGCPMAADDLVGNMPTEKLLNYAAQNKIETGVNGLAFETAYNEALKTFP